MSELILYLSYLRVQLRSNAWWGISLIAAPEAEAGKSSHSRPGWSGVARPVSKQGPHTLYLELFVNLMVVLYRPTLPPQAVCVRRKLGQHAVGVGAAC